MDVCALEQKQRQLFEESPVSVSADSVEQAHPDQRLRRNMQDYLPAEGFLAVRLSAEVQSVEELQSALIGQLSQNSQETRRRYVQSLLHWFFADGFNGLARQTWVAYRDEAITSDILRFLYLRAEPIMGACVVSALYPLENGIAVPPDYFDRFLLTAMPGPAPAKTRERLKTNLMKLGFLERGRGKPDRLKPLNPTKTAFLLLLHQIFASKGPRTVELRHLFADPFWKYLGFKSEDAVRNLLRDAAAADMVGKYVVADQIEQVTTIWSFEEFVARKVKL